MRGTGVWALAVCCDAQLGAYGCGRHVPMACWAFVGHSIDVTLPDILTCAVYMGIQSASIRVVVYTYTCTSVTAPQRYDLDLSKAHGDGNAPSWRSTFRQTAGRPRMRWPWLKPSTSVHYFSHCRDTRSHTLALNRGERKDLAMTFGWDVVLSRTMGGCWWRDACWHSNYHFLSFFSLRPAPGTTTREIWYVLCQNGLVSAEATVPVPGRVVGVWCTCRTRRQYDGRLTDQRIAGTRRSGDSA